MLEKILAFLDTRGRRLIALASAIVITSTVLLLLLLNSTKIREKLDNREVQTLNSVLQQGKLTVIFENSTLSHFKNKNISLGYEYEMLKEIAKKLNLKLEVLGFEYRKEMNKALLAGKGHLIADFRAISSSHGSDFIYTVPHTWSHLSLVQRKPSKKDKKTVSVVENIYELEGKTIHVQHNSIAHKKLKYFADEYAIEMGIVAVDQTREELIEQVSKGEIEFTVVEQEIIAANKQLYDNLEYSLQLSFAYRIAFTLRHDATELRDTINSLLGDYLISKKYTALYSKYIANETKYFHRRMNLLLLNGSQISKLDDKIRQEAQKLGWDWRLLSSLIMQESRFEAYITSSQGTFGLMQFMPRTGAKYGVYPNSTPEAQVEGGAKYLAFLQNMYADVLDPVQRCKFVLASYNGGPAHVLDAKRLAKHFEEDHTDWDNVVSKYMEKLKEPEFYNHEVVRSGAYNAGHSLKYVQTVVNRYIEYTATYPD
jgi:membrane-bound lytic murein transglycosylase F